MPKLKIGSIEDDKPVSLTVKLPAMVYRDLTAYAEILNREGRQSTADPTTLVAPMLARFMATDREFRKLRRGIQQKGSASAAAKIRVRQLDCSDDRLCAFADNCMCEYGSRSRAVACLVGRLRRDLADHLRSHVLELVLEFDFLRNGYAVLGDARRHKTLLKHSTPRSILSRASVENVPPLRS
jgi:hypothetical protein